MSPEGSGPKKRCDEAVVRGDPQVLTRLFDCYRADLMAFLRRRCGDATDAEDAVQDAFVAAHRYIDGFRGETSIKSWLYRLASSACLRMRRGRKNDPRLHAALDEGDHAQRDQAQMEALMEARLMPLKEALHALSPENRAVLLMVDGEGMSSAEAGEQLGLSPGAVRSRLHRVRQQLRELLGAS